MGKKEMNARLKQRTMKQQLNRLFPNKVTIQIPLNEELLSDWKLPQLDLDFEILKSQSNNFLNRVGVDIIKDQALTNVEKIIGLAWNHHFKHCTDPSFKDTELSLPISTESIRYGLNIFLGIQNEIKCLKKSLEDISLSSGNDDVSQGFKISLLPSSSGVPNNYVDGTEMKDSPDHSLPSPSALNENLNLDTVDPEVGKKRDTGHELRPGSSSISKTLDHPRDFRELLKNFDDPILNSARKQAVIHVFQQCLLDPSNIEVSFENFPYYLSETTKNVLIASTYIPLKCNKFAKYTSDLLSVCPRILLSGPVDSDLYKEMLTKALAKHFAAKLLIVDSLLLPGGSMVKEVGLIKENSLSERATVLAKCVEHPATMYCKNSVSGVEAEIPGGSPITSKTYTFKKGDRVKYRGGLSPGKTPLRGPNYGYKGKVVLAFEDSGASNVGVRFDRLIPDGNDLGGLCEDNHGFFCAADLLLLDISFDDIDKLAINGLFEVASRESRSSPLILFVKETEKSMISNPDTYGVYESNLENLPKNVVVVASHTQTDSQKEKDSVSRMFDRSKETPKTMKQLNHLFPEEVTIQMPLDEKLLSDWKQQLDREIEILKSQSNNVGIRAVLNRVGVECPDLDELSIKDQALTSENVEKIVGWALSHHFMHCTEPSLKDTKLSISTECIRYGLNLFLAIQNETKEF